ncbi:MAG: hypothetical protein ACR2H4_08475 [Pyrinomonadaceae bacterium]|jgi:hypothetical protein
MNNQTTKSRLLVLCAAVLFVASVGLVTFAPVGQTSNQQPAAGGPTAEKTVEQNKKEY